MKTLKVLSALLSYPSEELIGAGEEMKSVLAREAILPAPHVAALSRMIDGFAASDVVELQERYTFLFDRTRSLSLHLFEHVHGESRDRGQAMVDLIALYEAGGFSPTASELPDYLPLFLEYASTREPAEAIELIGQPAHVLAALHERLRKRGTPYAVVLGALLALSKARLDAAALAALRAEPDPEPDDLASLDAAWEEEEVLFGPGAAACGKDSIISKVRQAQRPAPGSGTRGHAGPQTSITTARSPRA
ncbi:MAG: nitrate reductase molybdenum cofactor assembly chaperone [Hyphomicrobiaceae bacterium]|nr:nitrate reductase molybdenum cofactor assembly chaperone [Hyphomicrobiaceae bacterium]